MKSVYSRIAGQSVEIIAALSDGIFAVAMTLLVLDLRLPVGEAIHTEQDFWHSLARNSRRLLMYSMSFLNFGIFWVGQQTQLNQVKQADANLSWVHWAFLFAVTLTPFSTLLLAEFTVRRTALLLYWLNLIALGGVLFLSWGYAARAKLVIEDLPAEVPASICRRIMVGQSLYALAATLCVFGTYGSFALMVAVQLCYALGISFGKPGTASGG
jgi:uncharacterized membrane protein